MTPSTSKVFLQQEQCLEHVHKLFEISRWDDEEESMSCVSLCGTHDKLLEVLQLGDEITTLVDGEILRLRVLKEGSADIEQVRRRILLQADLLRAVMLVSYKLLSKVGALPMTSSKGDKSTDDHLKVIIGQVKILLQVLSYKYSENLPSNAADREKLPSNFPLFEELLQQQGQTSNDVDDNNIAFDKDQLEQEEDELLRMAHTPTPQEGRHAPAVGATRTANMDVDNAVPSTTTLLHAPMVSEDRNLTTVSVELDGRGFLRARTPLNSTIDAPSSGDSIWLLTAETTIFYNTPMLRLSNIVTYCKSSFTASKISLNVGSQGHVWWERISAIVQRLKVASELQEQVQSAWTTEVFQEQGYVSKGLVSYPSTILF